MGDLINQFREMFASLSMARKISMVVVLGVAVAVLSYLVHTANQASMEPLFTNLNSQDMGSILTELDKQGIRYQVNQDHRTVLVPATQVLDVRLKLAGAGLPRFGGVGFEIFDKGGFGMSNFEQRVNFQRALEGELARTISHFKEVESARVHLVLPEKSLFADSQQMASASVVVKLGSAGRLSKAKVNSITYLVASGVEALDAEQVTVVDTQGHLLSAGGQDQGMIAGGQAFDQKFQIEKSYEKRIVELLSPIIGYGKVVARVTMGLDFTRSEKTAEIVDPSKSAVLSESRTTAKRTEAAGGGGGVAGAAGNAAGGGAGGGGGASGSSDEGSEKITYQVSKSIQREVSPMGDIKKMSVAILVDGKYEDKEGEMVYTPRPQEELSKIEELVKNAIGFSSDRGDQFKIENLAFESPEKGMEAAKAWYEQKNTYGFLISVIGNVLAVLMIILVFLFVLRPMIRSWGGGPQGSGGAGGNLIEGEIGGDVSQLVRADPMAAANAIRQWLK